mmetsp:Transcript_62823/g.182259  ORF Transcript_62823/g.182259 Transcript_62823/m.182259 type:complete len:350 (+) Transcript_62823:474-1523(+)
MWCGTPALTRGSVRHVVLASAASGRVRDLSTPAALGAAGGGGGKSGRCRSVGTSRSGIGGLLVFGTRLVVGMAGVHALPILGGRHSAKDFFVLFVQLRARLLLYRWRPLAVALNIRAQRIAAHLARVLEAGRGPFALPAALALGDQHHLKEPLHLWVLALGLLRCGHQHGGGLAPILQFDQRLSFSHQGLRRAPVHGEGIVGATDCLLVIAGALGAPRELQRGKRDVLEACQSQVEQVAGHCVNLLAEESFADDIKVVAADFVLHEVPSAQIHEHIVLELRVSSVDHRKLSIRIQHIIVVIQELRLLRVLHGRIAEADGLLVVLQRLRQVGRFQRLVPRSLCRHGFGGL